MLNCSAQLDIIGKIKDYNGIQINLMGLLIPDYSLILVEVSVIFGYQIYRYIKTQMHD